MSIDTLEKEQQVINGVDLQHLGKAIQAVSDKPEAGDYTFYTETVWKQGAISHTDVKRKLKGSEDKQTVHSLVIDEPAGLLGTDTAANPVEHILAGLAGCLAIGVSYNAAARNITLEELKVNLEGSLNLQGFLGIDQQVRPGYEQINLAFHIKSDASQSELESLIDHVKATSPVLDIISHPVPISVKVN